MHSCSVRRVETHRGLRVCVVRAGGVDLGKVLLELGHHLVALRLHEVGKPLEVCADTVAVQQGALRA